MSLLYNLIQPAIHVARHDWADELIFMLYESSSSE